MGDRKRALAEQALSLQEQMRNKEKVHEEQRQEDLANARAIADVVAQFKADEQAKANDRRLKMKAYEQALRAQKMEKNEARRLELAGPMSARERDLNASLLRRAQTH